ncbi:MAG: hypothetical protein AAGF92_14585 [Myxococcota bacterium]
MSKRKREPSPEELRAREIRELRRKPPPPKSGWAEISTAAEARIPGCLAPEVQEEIRAAWSDLWELQRRFASLAATVRPSPGDDKTDRRAVRDAREEFRRMQEHLEALRYRAYRETHAKTPRQFVAETHPHRDEDAVQIRDEGRILERRIQGQLDRHALVLNWPEASDEQRDRARKTAARAIVQQFHVVHIVTPTIHARCVDAPNDQDSDERKIAAWNALYQAVKSALDRAATKHERGDKDIIEYRADRIGIAALRAWGCSRDDAANFFAREASDTD